MQSSPTVVLRNVSKTYLITNDGSERSINPFRHRERVQALKPMSLVTYSGESVGVLGLNGSGKSTLLRIIGGSETPTTGIVGVSEKPTLLGVSSALQPELSGHQNVYLGLLAMGMAPSEARPLVQPIIEWAELEDAAKRAMRTYSSGQQARLKFAIATAVRREILLVDEALSTGDGAFAEKARVRMNQFLENAGTVFIVSHGSGTIKQHCTRAIWLHKGEVIADGDVSFVSKTYDAWVRRVGRGEFDVANRIIERRKRLYTAPEITLRSELPSA